ncbi:MAG TPA: hypothetical protein ENI23_16005 [bacterium]|nr:hypothetical protein [bacterium]
MTILNLQTFEGADDARHWIGASHGFSNSILNIIIGSSFNTFRGGTFRFEANIPKNVLINEAYLTFIALGNDTNTFVNVEIQADDSDDSNQIVDDDDYHTRVLTGVPVNWDNLPGWVSNTPYNSPDISSVIQAVVNRSGWNSGNALNLVLTDNGSSGGAIRSLHSFESNPSKSPTLYIEYTELPTVISIPVGAMLFEGQSVSVLQNFKRLFNLVTPEFNLIETVIDPVEDKDVVLDQFDDVEIVNTKGTWS